MSEAFALSADVIFTGEERLPGHALIVRDGMVEDIVERSLLPGSVRFAGHYAGVIAPGFVDLQVNGGGGIMLNDRQDVEAIRTICAAHAPFGTTALLATLITDTPDVTARAIAAGEAAAKAHIPGFLGLHLEGPHLSVARKGAHDPALIRPMTDADRDALIAAAPRVPALKVTIAPESVTPEQVGDLVGAGVHVSLGHSETSEATARAYAEAGARLVTHLFNAMSQVGNREPGLAGAAIDTGSLWAGLIADGIHVNPATLGIALRAKRGPGRLYLVTDAMATIGTDMRLFTLNGRTIKREKGRLTLDDGTLAGADLDMISAVRFMHEVMGLAEDEALRMASLYPAQAMELSDTHGRLDSGTRADFICLGDELSIRSVWIGGERVYRFTEQ